jgi:hypothetical protein
MEDGNFIPDTRTHAEKLASALYWSKKTPQERQAEAL